MIDRINTEIKPKKKLIRLKEDEFKFLSDYISCMKSIAEGLDLLQGDKHASLGYVLPTLYTIKIEVNRAVMITDYQSTIRRNLMQCFDKRFFDIMDICETNKTFIMASASHPKFKLSWVPENDLSTAEKLFVDTCLNLNCDFQDRATGDNSIDSDNENSNFFFSFGRNERRQFQEFISRRLEIVQYLENHSRKKRNSSFVSNSLLCI